jgi:hypothetical protein
MNFLNKKYKINLISEKWDIISSNYSVEIIPKINECIYINEEYYQVINIIHNFDIKNSNLTVVIEKINNERK